MPLNRQPHADDFVRTLIEGVDLTSNPKRAFTGEPHTFDVVIDSKRYRSEAMEEVAWYDEKDHEFGNYAFEEVLWRTKSGQWLLAGQGWDATPWQHGSEWGGYGYIILTPQEAQKWLELRGEHETLLEHFPVEDA